MATIIDSSLELYSKSGSSRFGQVQQFYGLTKTGKRITRRQLTPIEAATVGLAKSLKRYKIAKEIRYVLVDEMSRLPQLAHMNMMILAAALALIEDLIREFRVSSGRELQQALTAEVFQDKVGKYIKPSRLDIDRDITDMEYIKLKEGVLRYFRTVTLFRDQQAQMMEFRIEERQAEERRVDYQRRLEREEGEEDEDEEEGEGGAEGQEPEADEDEDDFAGGEEGGEEDDEEERAVRLELPLPLPEAPVPAFTGGARPEVPVGVPLPPPVQQIPPKIAPPPPRRPQPPEAVIPGGEPPLPTGPLRQPPLPTGPLRQPPLPSGPIRQPPLPSSPLREPPLPTGPITPARQPPRPSEPVSAQPPPPGEGPRQMPRLPARPTGAAAPAGPIKLGPPKPAARPTGPVAPERPAALPALGARPTGAAAPERPAALPTALGARPGALGGRPTGTAGGRAVGRTYRTLRERLIPKIPLTLPPRPVPQIELGNVASAETWLRDPENRLRMLELKIEFTHSPTIPIETFVNQTLIANREEFEPYLKYAEQIFIGLNRAQPTRETLEKLEGLRQSYRNLISDFTVTLSRSDPQSIIRKIYPNANITVVPSVGECYFCAVAQAVNKTTDGVRADLANYLRRLQLQNPDQYATYVEDAKEGCERDSRLRALPLDELLDTFPDFLEVPCQEGLRDCTDCMWGGSQFNKLVAEVYKLPVVNLATFELPGRLSIQLYLEMPSSVKDVTAEVERYTGPVIGVLGTGAHYDYIEFS